MKIRKINSIVRSFLREGSIDKDSGIKICDVTEEVLDVKPFVNDENIQFGRKSGYEVYAREFWALCRNKLYKLPSTELKSNDFSDNYSFADSVGEELLKAGLKPEFLVEVDTSTQINWKEGYIDSRDIYSWMTIWQIQAGLRYIHPQGLEIYFDKRLKLTEEQSSLVAIEEIAFRSLISSLTDDFRGEEREGKTPRRWDYYKKLILIKKLPSLASKLEKANFIDEAKMDDCLGMQVFIAPDPDRIYSRETFAVCKGKIFPLQVGDQPGTDGTIKEVLSKLGLDPECVVIFDCHEDDRDKNYKFVHVIVCK